MATPQAAVAMVAAAALTAITFWVPNVRCIFWVASSLIGMAGAIMVHTLDVSTQRNASLAGVYIMGFYNVPWVFMLSLSSSNTAGATKKSFMGVSIAVVYGELSFPVRKKKTVLTPFKLLATSLALSSSAESRHPTTHSESAACYVPLLSWRQRGWRTICFA
jgi:hypothetical protein